MNKLIGLLIGTALFFSCSKEGPGGKATISGQVKHHATLIRGAVVYIKYGAKELPGTNLTLYDANTPVDAQAHYEFANLKRGDYYLFTVGFDSIINNPVKGGVPVQIKDRSETLVIDIPVME